MLPYLGKTKYIHPDGTKTGDLDRSEKTSNSICRNSGGASSVSEQCTPRWEDDVTYRASSQSSASSRRSSGAFNRKAAPGGPADEASRSEATS
jgi:hypothetical protein